MTAQLNLFDRPLLARRRDPVTSKQAAQRALNFVCSHEATIFGAICDAGEKGATYREIARATGMEPVAVARRLKAMEVRGLIERSALSDCSGFEARDGCAIWWRTQSADSAR